MIRYISTLILQLIFVLVIFSQTNPNHVWVNGYYRSNGTYVKGHYRTAPNHTNVDNFSTRGNINPYTLERGYVKPDGQDNPWNNEVEHKMSRDFVNIEPYYGSSTYRNNSEKTYSTSSNSIETSTFNASTNTSTATSNSNSWYSKGDQVNVRFEPTTNSKIAFRINRGDLLYVNKKSNTTSFVKGYGYDYWYEVTYNNLTGWVFGKLIGQQNYNSSELDDWNGDLQYVNANSVNVRTEPDTSIGKVIFQLSKNQEIEILAKTTNKYKVGKYGIDYWYYIKAENKTGWVFGGLIEL